MAPNHGGDPLGSILGTVISRHNRNFDFLRKIRLLGHGDFLTVLTHFLDPMGPHWRQDGP